MSSLTPSTRLVNRIRRRFSIAPSFRAASARTERRGERSERVRIDPTPRATRIGGKKGNDAPEVKLIRIARFFRMGATVVLVSLARSDESVDEEAAEENDEMERRNSGLTVVASVGP